MITKRQLKNIANTSSGYTFREAIKPSKEGNIFVLQAKNINADKYIDKLDELTRVSLDIPRSNSYVSIDDVLLTSRGSNNFRSTVFKDAAKNVVASSSVNIIRVKDSRILPEYLAMYFNSSEGQLMLSQIVSGNYIKTLLRKNMEDLTIPVPPIDKQRAIIALNENIRKQQKIAERRNQLVSNIINVSLKNLITS